MRIQIKPLVLLLLVASLSGCSGASKPQSLDLRSRVKRIQLDNGLTALLLNRVGAPVFSTQIKVKVGNLEEQKGAYGLAHFFEHMAFKGTQKIGTKDWAKEQVILDQVFKVGTKIAELKKQGKAPSEYADLITQRKKLEAEQKEFIVKNEFTEIFQSNGGVGLNASTSNDFTTYYISLPANKMELWAYMESERLKAPVMREFFTEVDVVAEERRMRIDNTPSGQLYEALVNTAFDKSPYGEVVIGPAKDIQVYTPKVAKEFYEKYYIPSRMVVSVVGNFDIKKAETIIRKYFGSIPTKKEPGPNFSKENFDTKTFPRETTVKGPDKSRFYIGYHRPAHPHVDDIVFDVAQDVLCDGRTSRLYKKLVIEDRIASYVSCYVSIPGARADSMFAFYAMPFEGTTNKELRAAIFKELEQFKKEGPTKHELERVKNKLDAELIYSLQSNSGLASQLAFYQSLTGDWEYIYELKDRVNQIKADEVKTVVKKYFVPSREVTAYYETEAAK